jgi:hypothetical protein
MSAINSWRDCFTFDDLLTMNQKWMLRVIEDRSKYDELVVQRPYPSTRDILFNQRGLLLKRAYEGKTFNSKQGEFKCTYKQRAYVEGIMQHDRAIKLFDKLKEDKNLLVVIMECEDGGALPTRIIAKNFDEKIPLRLLPFDQDGIMLNAIKEKFKFDIMVEMLMGWKVERQLGAHQFKSFTGVIEKNMERLKKFKEQILGNGDKNKRRKELYPNIEEMGITHLTSFIPSKEAELLGPAYGNALYARFIGMKNLVSITIMDKEWGRDDYLWIKLIQNM